MIAYGSAFRLFVTVTTTAGAAYTTSGTPPSIYLSKDGGAEAASTNAASHLGHGLWLLQLTAAEMTAAVVGYVTDCAGCVPVGGQIVTESTYTAALAAQIGTNLDEAISASVTAINGAMSTAISGAATAIEAAIPSGANNAAALLGATIDSGLTVEAMLHISLAVLAGKATVTDNGNGTSTVAYKRQDGTTTALTVTFDASGNRSASTVGTD